MVPTACTKYILRVTVVTGSQVRKTVLLSYIHTWPSSHKEALLYGDGTIKRA